MKLEKWGGWWPAPPKEKESLRDRVAAIVQAIAESAPDYWNGYETFGILDQDIVVNDILAAVVECDGEVLEVFGNG